MNNCKPYLDILKELGYNILEDDLESVYNLNTPDEECYVIYKPVYFKNQARVELELSCCGLEKCKNYHENNDPSILDLCRIKAYYIDNSELFENNNNCLEYFCYRNKDSGLYSINIITPELFSIILHAKESQESELKHSNKILQRYLDVYYNIIEKIINPVAKIKGLILLNPSIFNSGLDNTHNNRNIELDYCSKNDNWETKFTIGIDYITGKLYFYENISNVIFDIENIITTKGRFKELLKKHNI